MAKGEIMLLRTTYDIAWVRIGVDTDGFIKPMWISLHFYDDTPSYAASVEIEKRLLDLVDYAEGWENRIKKNHGGLI